MERKLATVLFADLVESTQLLTSADPEVVRRRVTRYFERVSNHVEQHGGVVEKFAGDAVMAAFGIPTAHEDDAERAARAALAIVDAVQALGLEVRIGLEAGELVIDDGETSTFATGEAVNVAARLQQAAAPGEILIGPVVRELTIGRFEVEERGRFEPRGLGRELDAWRLIRPQQGLGRALRLTSPFIGREPELELLENTWSRALRDRRAHLVTIYGQPGIGKSRLAREFVADIGGATVLAGRCLPYGEAITFAPLAEMLKAAAGIADDDTADKATAKLRTCCADDAVADLLGVACGFLETFSGTRSDQEIAWAAHEWATTLANVQPLVLCFEDIHWAEEPLLDLISHLSERVRGVPLLIVCLSRPELLESRRSWGGGRLRSVAIELEPLAPRASERLLDALAGGDLATDERHAVLDRAEGNPLFVEETVRMLHEGASERMNGRIPETVQALIAARIDRLPPGGKAVVQRGAVIGRVFGAGAINALTDDETAVEAALDELVARELLSPEGGSSTSGERAYRFQHILIRDVAYASLSKDARAELHRRFADWLYQQGGAEELEIRAHHLDRATAFLTELDGAVPPELVQETAASLQAAGERALARHDDRIGRRLLVRAVALEPTLERRFQAGVAAWRLGDLPAVSLEMERVASEAAAVGDNEIEGNALTALAEMTLNRLGDIPRAKELAERGLLLLGPNSRFRCLMVCGAIARWQGAREEHERYVQEALELAQRLDRADLEAQATRTLAETYSTQLRYAEARALAAHALQLAEQSGSVHARALALAENGHLHLCLGDLNEAAVALEEALGLYVDMGASLDRGRTLMRLAEVAVHRGEYTNAKELLRESIRVLKPIEDRGTLCESQRTLADVLTEQGELDEAERLALEAMETVGPHDVSSQASTRTSLAFVRVAQGREDEAEALMREAWARIEGTGYLALEAAILGELDQLLRARGLLDNAVTARLAVFAAVTPRALEFATSVARVRR